MQAARGRSSVVATLNVKNFPNELYEKLKEQAVRHQRSVAGEVIWQLRQATAAPEELSILTLKGLGKELWRERGAAAHVETERGSWD